MSDMIPEPYLASCKAPQAEWPKKPFYEMVFCKEGMGRYVLRIYPQQVNQDGIVFVSDYDSEMVAKDFNEIWGKT